MNQEFHHQKGKTTIPTIIHQSTHDVSIFSDALVAQTNSDIDVYRQTNDYLRGLFQKSQYKEWTDVIRLLFGILGIKIPEITEQILQDETTLLSYLQFFLDDLDSRTTDLIGGIDETIPENDAH